MAVHIHVTSGDAYVDDRRLTITVTDADDATVDLSATDLTFMVKRRRSDADADALITKVTPAEIEIASPQTGATKGVAYLSLEESDTADLNGRFLWELEGEDSAGKVTLADGGFYVKRDLIGVA